LEEWKSQNISLKISSDGDPKGSGKSPNISFRLMEIKLFSASLQIISKTSVEVESSDKFE
jgi:hypothetical protein